MACGETVEVSCYGLGSEFALLLSGLWQLVAAESSGAPAVHQGLNQRRKVQTKHCSKVSSAPWFGVEPPAVRRLG
jgi:hypothetical protein